jgi:hypothetical protein
MASLSLLKDFFTRVPIASTRMRNSNTEWLSLLLAGLLALLFVRVRRPQMSRGFETTLLLTVLAFL